MFEKTKQTIVLFRNKNLSVFSCIVEQYFSLYLRKIFKDIMYLKQ